MGFLKAYEYHQVNKDINNELKLSKKIRIISFNPSRNHICKDLHIGVFDNKMIEDFYVNPRNISIKSSYLTKDDIDKLNKYFSIYGMDYLEYQLYKISFKELEKRKENRL